MSPLAFLKRLLHFHNLWKGIVLIFVILCYWWFFWPVYEWSVGFRTFESIFTAGQQTYLFVLGAIVTVPSIFIWKRIILG